MIDQLIRSKLFKLIPDKRKQCTDTKNVVAPASELAPKRCKLKIATETASELEKSMPDKG